MCIDNDRREKLIIPIEISYFNLHFAIKVKKCSEKLKSIWKANRIAIKSTVQLKETCFRHSNWFVK